MKHQLFFLLLIALAMTACSGIGPAGGDVVRVTAVQQDVFAGLKAEELDKISEFRKAARQRAGSPIAIAGVEHGASREYTAEQYVRQYPDRVRLGKGGIDYRVGGNDVLNIIVFDEDNLSRKVRVSREGNITFPLIGRLHIDGTTTTEIEDLIARKLAEGQYLLDAQVSVSVSEYGSKRYKVLGAVQSPGSYSLKAEELLLDAISNAGGIDSSEGGKVAMIIRNENPLAGNGNNIKVVISVELDKLLRGADQVSNLPLFDQDMIYIPRAEQFYIMGQVNTPGSYTFPDQDVSLVEAIGTAGGFTPIAARSRTRIIRVENGQEKIITVNVDAITGAGRKIQDVTIKPGDIIVVPESFF